MGEDVGMKLKVRGLVYTFFFAWYDGWIGYYWDRKNKVLYLCPFFWCVISIEKEDKHEYFR